MKGYRTYIIAAVFILLGGAIIYLLPAHADAGVALMAGGMSFAGMRSITTTPPGQSTTPAPTNPPGPPT